MVSIESSNGVFGAGQRLLYASRDHRRRIRAELTQVNEKSRVLLRRTKKAEDRACGFGRAFPEAIASSTLAAESGALG
jgi:hypothetical protein